MIPARGNPWSFPCGGFDGYDSDPIRASGTDMTGIRLVELEVPPVLARAMANRWRDGSGFIQVPVEMARALLRNDVWSALNREIADRLGVIGRSTVTTTAAPVTTTYRYRDFN